MKLTAAALVLMMALGCQTNHAARTHAPHTDPYRFSNAVFKVQLDMIEHRPVTMEDLGMSRWGFEATLFAKDTLNSHGSWREVYGMSMSDLIIAVDGPHPTGCPSPEEEP